MSRTSLTLAGVVLALTLVVPLAASAKDCINDSQCAAEQPPGQTCNLMLGACGWSPTSGVGKCTATCKGECTINSDGTATCSADLLTPKPKPTDLGQTSGLLTPSPKPADLGQTSGTTGGSQQTTQTPGTSGGSQQTQTTSGSSGGTGLINPLSAGTNLQTLLQAILKFVVQIGTVVVVLMLVYVGFLFVTAQGEPGKISEAKQALLWTIVGALILLGAQAIASGIQATANALSTGT